MSKTDSAPLFGAMNMSWGHRSLAMLMYFDVHEVTMAIQRGNENPNIGKAIINHPLVW